MPYDRKHWESMKRRRDRRLSAMVKLMNDTKWREVFTVLALKDIRFCLFCMDGPGMEHCRPQSIRCSWVGPTGLLDPGFGGPCQYTDVQSIWIPREIEWAEIRDGKIYRSTRQTQDIEELMRNLNSVGKLPLNKKDDGVELVAYI